MRVYIFSSLKVGCIHYQNINVRGCAGMCSVSSFHHVIGDGT